MTQQPPTHFGFETVAWEEKEKKVRAVFESVAPSYDRMNDIMSWGLHRLWKRFTTELSHVRPGQCVLDLAGGSGDLTLQLCKKVGTEGLVVLADINQAMLSQGRDRLINQGTYDTIRFIQANGECLPFAENTFHCIIIGFGLRNITDKAAALRAMYKTCKPGGKLMVLEFSTPIFPGLRTGYHHYLFHVIPKLGRWIADDEASYRYLAESIQMHPPQLELQNMIEQAGFEDCHYLNLTGGIVALHTAYKY